MTAALAVLAQHIDQPTQRHRCVLLDQLRLRCLDCARTIDLRSLASLPTGSTSTSDGPPPLHAPDRCPDHPGQRTGACGPCRAEQLEAQRSLPAQPTADVAARAAEARAEIARVADRRRARQSEET